MPREVVSYGEGQTEIGATKSRVDTVNVTYSQVDKPKNS